MIGPAPPELSPGRSACQGTPGSSAP